MPKSFRPAIGGPSALRTFDNGKRLIGVVYTIPGQGELVKSGVAVMDGIGTNFGLGLYPVRSTEILFGDVVAAGTDVKSVMPGRTCALGD